jgi:transcriptional regulator with XRE-family HTH domain
MKGVDIDMKRCTINQHIRKHLNISGRELAERVEVTKQTISNYETGKCCFRPLERVIEIELDLAIEQCEDILIKELCEYLKLKREEEV